MTSFTKFIRPQTARPGRTTARDLDILWAILRYRFCSTSHLVRLVGGNEDVTHRRLRRLWELGLISRWAFPGIRAHSEFFYYLENQAALHLLAEYRGLIVHPHMREELSNNRDKDYGGAAARGQHMQLGFLQHSLMIARLHYCLEQACHKVGTVRLERWTQGSQLSGHKVEVPKVQSSRSGGQYVWRETDATEMLPVEPDGLFTLRFLTRPKDEQLGHFLYEADRGTMGTTDLVRKMRAYYHFIVRQQRHKSAFGLHPIRAVLFETTDEARGQQLMGMANHALVTGPGKRSGLFWFTITPLLVGTADRGEKPAYLDQPEIILHKIWALPDRSLHALSDRENR